MIALTDAPITMEQAHREGRHATRDPWWTRTCPNCVASQPEQTYASVTETDASAPSDHDGATS